MSDELAEINGVKPKVSLGDNEEREVKSKTSSSKYKCKRTFDHYYCNCPAWRNQSGVQVNSRTCKHLKDLLGEKYEEERIKLKRGDVNSSAPAATGKGAKKGKAPASKGKAAAGRKRKKDEEEEEAEEDEEPAPKTRAKRTRRTKADEDEEEEEEEEKKPRSKRSAPASKGRGGKPASTRGKKAEPKKEPEEDVEMEDAEEEEEEEKEVKKPRSKRSAPASKGRGGKPATRGKKAEPEEDAEMEDAEEEDAAEADPNDELAVINGVKPKVYMKDGDETEVSSQTSSSKYKVKRTWDHYYCTCPAWRNQGGVPVNARSCKHLKQLLGDKYEAERMKLKNPDGAQAAPASKSGGSSKPKSSAAKDKKVPELLLANKWDLDDGPDPTGWWISEKLDGVRTYFDGKKMYSRLGNPFTPPQWFLDKLPTDVTLDGELFGGRGEFQNTVSIVKTVNSPHWKGITFQIFDMPSAGSLPFEERLEKIKELFAEGSGTHACPEVVVVDHVKAESREHVLEKLKEVESLGGEGLMLRKPESVYEGKRSSTLLKIKSFYDAEAKVTGYVDGKGRHKGVMGALNCVMESGKKFNVGTGFSDKQRKTPPKVGSIIVYRFQELTKDGVPRFPSYIGEAADKTEPKDAEVPEHRKTTAGGAKDDA